MSVFVPIYRLQLVREANFRTASKRIYGPQDAAAILSAYLDGADREHFVVLTLDAKGRATGIQTVAVGTLDRVDVYPRDVFKFAVHMNAASIVVGHNHPSGDPEPSPADQAVTRRLVDAGEILGIPLVDHVVLGDNGAFVSLTQGITASPREGAAESRASSR